MHDDDDDEEPHTPCTFDKPWFSVLLMKLAMTMCLPLYYGFGWGKSEGAQALKPDTIKRVPAVWFRSLKHNSRQRGVFRVSSSIYQMTRAL